jgi:hypothetical protein
MNIILLALVLGQSPAKETIPEPFIVNQVKPDKLSKSDFEKAKDLVLKLPQIQKQIEVYGKNYRGEANLADPKKNDDTKYLYFYFKDGNEYLGQSVYVNLTEWKAAFRIYTDVEDKKTTELEKTKKEKK